MRNYYMFGLHRSGTNVFERSVGINFNYTSKSNHTNFNQTWKHSFVGSEHADPEDIIIVVYKNIYTWLESVLIRSPYDGHHIFRSAQHQNQIPEFYKDHISNIESNNYFINNLVTLEGMVDLYCKFLQMHKDQKDSGKKVYFFSYEDLLTQDSYLSSFSKIAEIFNVALPNPIKPLPGKVTLSPNFNPRDNQNYINKQTRFFPQDILDIITDRKNDDIIDSIDKIKL